MSPIRATTSRGNASRPADAGSSAMALVASRSTPSAVAWASPTSTALRNSFVASWVLTADDRRGALRRPVWRRGLVHPDRNDEPRNRGERGDRPDRCFDADEVSDDPGEQRTDGVAHVAPQPVDADGSGAPARVRDVADCGEQGRVH